jgi:hypothetical protein
MFLYIWQCVYMLERGSACVCGAQEKKCQKRRTRALILSLAGERVLSFDWTVAFTARVFIG